MKYDVLRLMRRVRDARGVSTSERTVMLMLLLHLNEHTGQCNPSNKLLEAECELTDRGLVGVLTRLEKRGWIRWIRGIGRGNKSEFELFPEEIKGELSSGFSEEKTNVVPLLEEEKANSVRVLEQEKGELSSGFTEEKANDVRMHPYERRIYSSSSSARVREGDVPPESPSSEPPNSPLTRTLCDVCALMPDALGEKHRGQLAEVTAWLRSVYPSDDEAALAVAERYGQGVWDKPKPPHLPQIKSDWRRMERIIQAANTTQNATDSNFHPSGDGGTKPPQRQPRPAQNEFQRNAADRRAARAQLAAKYASES